MAHTLVGEEPVTGSRLQPHQLVVADDAHVLEAVVRDVAPLVGWR